MRVTTCSVYDLPSPGDSLRVLVTRYWPRGVKKEGQDLWLPELGPSKELIREWKAGRIPWEEFQSRYLDEFNRGAKGGWLKEIALAAEEAGAKRVALMCACRDTSHCHSAILREMLGGGGGKAVGARGVDKETKI